MSKGSAVMCTRGKNKEVCIHNLILIFVFFSLITEEIAADVIACLVFHLDPRRDLGAISLDSISQTALM